ncbi:unnamed protein product, partial [Effrenium voratum]
GLRLDNTTSAFQSMDQPSAVETKGLSLRHVPVILHIYHVGDSAGMGLFNQALRPFGMGAFHCGVEVHGEEWSFRDVMPGHQDKAIFGCEPRRCRGHRYQESLELGFTYLSKKEVRQLLQLMLARWPGAKYNVLSNNCCHFCDEFCRLLGVGAIPSRLFTLAKLARAMLTSMQALEQRRQDAAAFIRGSEAFQVGCCTPAATAPKEHPARGEQALAGSRNSVVGWFLSLRTGMHCMSQMIFGQTPKVAASQGLVKPTCCHILHRGWESGRCPLGLFGLV